MAASLTENARTGEQLASAPEGVDMFVFNEQNVIVWHTAAY
jgi:hypothetical protein